MYKGFLQRSVASLGLLFALTAGAPAPALSQAADKDEPAKTRALSFKILSGVQDDGTLLYEDNSIHKIVYSRNGRYDQSALNTLNDLLRDPESGKASPGGIDPKLMDFLFALQTEIQKKQPGTEVVFDVISGYRSPETNERLRTDPNNPYRNSMDENSLHTHAKAIDFLLPDIDMESVRDSAWCLQKGGVGWYPENFEKFGRKYMHIDTGRVRYWGFTPKPLRSCPATAP